MYMCWEGYVLLTMAKSTTHLGLKPCLVVAVPNRVRIFILFLTSSASCLQYLSLKLHYEWCSFAIYVLYEPCMSPALKLSDTALWTLQCTQKYQYLTTIGTVLFRGVSPTCCYPINKRGTKSWQIGLSYVLPSCTSTADEACMLYSFVLSNWRTEMREGLEWG